MIAPIMGFFYIMGSKDIPVSYNNRDKFGFDNDVSTPVFNYSITNILDFIFNPVNSINVTDNKFQNLIIENCQTRLPVLKNISSTNFESKGFSALYKALTTLYDNQSTVNDYDETYTTIGNKLLSIDVTLDNRYLTNSISIESVILNTDKRISYVKFKFKIETIYLDFLIYFTPDTMFSKHVFDDMRYSVTYAVKNKSSDLNGISSILVENTNTSLLSMERNKNYSNVDSYDVLFNEISGVSIVDSYIRRFFIHNYMYDDYKLSDTTKIFTIKKYLIDLYSGVSNWRQKLSLEYPTLFTDSDTDIYPILTTVDKFNTRRVSSVKYDIISNEIERRGINIALTDKDIDIFMLEGIGIFDNNDYTNKTLANRNFLIPLMALSNNHPHINGPISDVFDSYSITYTGHRTNGESWEQFQFYVKMFVKIAIGITPWCYIGITDEEVSISLNLPSSIQFTTNRISAYGMEFLNSICFKFLNVSYTIHGLFEYGAI